MPIHGACIHVIDWYDMNNQRPLGTVQISYTERIKRLRVQTRINYQIPSNVKLAVYAADGDELTNNRMKISYFSSELRAH